MPQKRDWFCRPECYIARQSKKKSPMPPRLKRFIGMLILVALVVLYALIATTVATYRLAESPWYIHLAFFALSGLVWVLPAMAVICWMEKKPKDRGDSLTR